MMRDGVLFMDTIKRLICSRLKEQIQCPMMKYQLRSLPQIPMHQKSYISAGATSKGLPFCPGPATATIASQKGVADRRSVINRCCVIGYNHGTIHASIQLNQTESNWMPTLCQTILHLFTNFSSRRGSSVCQSF